MQGGNDDRIVYFVPLWPFEKALLQEVADVLDQSGFEPFHEHRTPVKKAFENWHWGRLVRDCLSDDLGEEQVINEYHGDKAKAYDSFLHFLGHQGEAEQSLFRANQLRDLNRDFLRQLSNQSIAMVDVRPTAEDALYWQTISRVYHPLGRSLIFKDSLFTSKGDYEIWKLIRKFMFLWSRPRDADLIQQILFSNASFQRLYEVVPLESDQEDADAAELQLDSRVHRQFELRKRIQDGEGSRWPDEEPKVDEGGELSANYLMFLIRNLGRTQPIEDPSTCMRFIPWDNLTIVDAKRLQVSGVNLQVPYMGGEVIKDWVLWTPPHAGFLWNCHLYTEDEVYQYNITKPWPFPGHFYKQQVLFAARELEETDFVAQLGSYWDAWNDCAITQRSPDGPILLLETLPGLRFRSRRSSQDVVAALSYFRNIVEAHAAGDLDRSSVRDIIGVEPEYLLQYEHSLRIIPESQLSDLSWDEPIGRGENGAVYGAIWRKPPGHLATTEFQEAEIPIVLKEVIPRSGVSIDPLKKLLKELDVTYVSLGGRAVGCVRFLGAALLKHPRVPPPTHDHPIDLQNTRITLLVFERATRGTVLNFLSEQYQKMSFIESWDLTVSALSSIANGIMSLHEHGVIHRDLHMNNILVTDRYYPNDPQSNHEFQYMISDIGEGKALNPNAEKLDLTRAYASYGAVEFRAPEVRSNEGWSFLAEAFSFGVITSKILNCRHIGCKAPPPDSILSRVSVYKDGETVPSNPAEYIVPTAVRKAIEPCMSHSSEGRPTMREVVLALNEVFPAVLPGGPSLENDSKIKWTYWRWTDSLNHGEKHAESTSQHDLDDIGDIESLES